MRLTNVYKKLLEIQTDLKAPKNQYNSFGKYNYRSCEDILEGLKPILKDKNCTLFISDSTELLGDRYYIKANVKFVDIESGEMIENTSSAREPLNKKGMDESQITGTASSYARKYALNGMFAIDDTKDADTDEYHKQNNKKENKETKVNKPNSQNDDKASEKQVKLIKSTLNRASNKTEWEQWIRETYVVEIEDLSKKEASEVIKQLKGD